MTLSAEISYQIEAKVDQVRLIIPRLTYLNANPSLATKSDEELLAQGTLIANQTTFINDVFAAASQCGYVIPDLADLQAELATVHSDYIAEMIIRAPNLF